MARTLRTSLLVAALWAGCTDPLPSPTGLDRLRILAVRAEPPSVRPGETTFVDALVVSPEGTEDVRVGWALCVDPPGSDPARCFETGPVRLLPAGPTLELTVPAALEPATPVFVLCLACQGGAPTLDEAAFRCRGGTDEVLAVKRIDTSATGNTNPRIARIGLGMATLSSGRSTRVSRCGGIFHCGASRLSILVSSASQDTIVDEGRRERVEDLVTAWVATGGTFTDPLGVGTAPQTNWDLPESSELTLWVVTRDERGGVTWETRQVSVE